MKPDLDAIRARASGTAASPHRQGRRDVPRNEDALTLLAYIDELERRTTYTIGETEWAQRIATLEQELRDARAAFESCNRARRHCEDECASLRARACITNDAGEASLINTLEHMLREERENVDTLRARVAELEAEVAILRPWSVMLKRAHGALTDAGCVVPLEFDQSIEHAINDLARRATHAEQLFVDEYDARRDVERQRDELLRVNQGAAQHGIITEYVRELTELLGIQRKNPTANETVNAAATEIETLRTTVEELKARIAVLEAMKP